MSAASGPELRATPAILDVVDLEAWDGLRLADRVLAPGDPRTAHVLVRAALGSSDGVRVTAAVVDGAIVGAVVSAVRRGTRDLLAVGVTPADRGRGLGRELLRRHVAAGAAPAQPWEASVTLAERDPAEPLPRAIRAAVARRLLEGAGFRVSAADGDVGAADPGAIIGRRA